jgi:hypothetical protein
VKKTGDTINRSRSERKRTAKMLATICQLVQKGLSIPHAAEKVHVHHTTIGRWRQDDPEFDAALRAAEAAFIEEQTQNIRGAGKRNWQASAWLLERKWPQFFSQPQIQLHMGVGKVEFKDLNAVMKRCQDSPEVMRLLRSMGDGVLAFQEPSPEKIVEGHEIKQVENAAG